MLFGELFSAEAESAYGSQADKDIADGAGNCAGGGVALRWLAIARLGGGDDGDGGGLGVVTAGALVGIGEELVGGFVLLVTALCALFPEVALYLRGWPKVQTSCVNSLSQTVQVW